MMEDKIRLDWLEDNASKIGINPDWRWDNNKEFTDIRKRIDKGMKINDTKNNILWIWRDRLLRKFGIGF